VLTALSGDAVACHVPLWKVSVAAVLALSLCPVAAADPGQAEGHEEEDEDAFGEFGAPEGVSGTVSACASLLSSCAVAAILGQLSPESTRQSNAHGALTAIKDVPDGGVVQPAGQSLLASTAPAVFSVLHTIPPVSCSAPAVSDVVAAALGCVSRLLSASVACAGPDCLSAAPVASALDTCTRFLDPAAGAAVTAAASHTALAVAKCAPAPFKAHVAALDATSRQVLESAVRAAVSGTAGVSAGSQQQQKSADGPKQGPGAATRLTINMARFKK